MKPSIRLATISAAADPEDYQAFLKAESKFAPILNATNPELSANFVCREPSR